MALKRLRDFSESETDEHSDSEEKVFSIKSLETGTNFVPKKNQLKQVAKKKYECPNCSKFFFQETVYWKHLRSHLQYHPFECDVCLECFNQEKLLRAHHKETHNSSKSYSCPDCSKTFTHISSRNRHCLMHLEKSPYSCPICSEKFSTVSSRSRHVKNHVVSCALCEIDFQNFTQLINHIGSVHRSKATEDDNLAKPDYIVPVDPSKDTGIDSSGTPVKRGNRLLKMKNEMNKKDFVCFVCEMRFSSEESMTTHLKAHRLFMCSHCPQFFSHLSSLREHEFAHTGNHPFKCNTCQSIFRSARLLSYHQKNCKLGCLSSQNPDEFHKILDTIHNSDFSDVIKAREEITEKALSIANTVCEASPSTQDIPSDTTESLLKKIEGNIMAHLSSEHLVSSQNLGCLFNEWRNTTQELETSNTPSLDLNNFVHLNWLFKFVVEINPVSYPLSTDMFQKIHHLNTFLLSQLGKGPECIPTRDNFLFLMYIQKEFSNILGYHCLSLFSEHTKTLPSS